MINSNFRNRLFSRTVLLFILLSFFTAGTGWSASYDFVTKWGTDLTGDGQFNYPNSVAVDSSGNIYVADTNNNRIQKFNSGGTFITKWGSSGTGDGQFSSPYGVAVDSSGNVYVVDRNNSRIQKFSSSGTFMLKWGSYGSGNGQFKNPYGISVDSSGNVYVADTYNYRIQKFDSSGTFITQWGSGSYGSGDGQFDLPYDVAVDSSGNVYVLDCLNARIQKFDSSGTFITKWGSNGTGDGQFYTAFVFGPYGISVDSSGNVYVADTYNYRIQKFNSNGTFITKWGSPGSGDGQFSGPSDVAVDSSGNVYVVDTSNNRLQKFNSSGTFISKWGTDFTGDGKLKSPNGVARDGSGNVYVADTGNNRIQKFDSSGTFLTKWGSSGTGDGLFSSPYGVAVDSSGNVYVADTYNSRIQKFNSSGTIVTKWGSSGTGDGLFSIPYSVAVDGSGNVYVADSGNNRIQKFDSNGVYNNKWGSSGSGDGQFNSPRGIAVDGSGNVYVADTYNYRIQKFNSSGTFLTKWGASGTGDGLFSSPYGVAVDGSGNVYVADTYNYRIQKFNSSGTFITKWGSMGSGNGQFSSPNGVAVDGSGKVFVADAGNNRIQKFAPSTTEGSISGRVTDASGNAVVNYGVKIVDPASGSQVYSASTSSNGYYAVDIPIPGNYKVYFNDYSSTYNASYVLNDSSQYYSNKTSLANADPVTVLAGQVAANINAVLAVGGQITGRVTDASGAAIVNVMALDPISNQTLRITRSDSNGNYTLSSLATGNYKVRFEPISGYRLAEYYNDKGNNLNGADLVAVTAGQVTPNINAQLMVGGTITGTVTNDSAAPLQSIQVDAMDLGGTYMGYASTSSSGLYQIQGLPPGQYRVRFSSWGSSSYYAPEWYDNKGTQGEGTLVTVLAYQTTANINAALSSGGKITGRVTDPGGNGMGSVSVYVYNLSNVYIIGNMTDSLGNSTVPLAPGTYKVRFVPSGSTYVPEWWNNKPDFATADQVTVTAGQTTTGINAQLAQPQNLTISGYVRTAGGTGIAGVVISGLTNSPVTDANGFYSDTVSYGFSGWAGAVIPGKMGYGFSPAYHSYNNINTNQTNQNFIGIPDGTTPTYYDQFPGPDIDSTKWNSWEMVREIRDFSGERKFFSKAVAYGSSVGNRLELKNPNFITHLEADVAVTEIDGNYGPNSDNVNAVPKAEVSGQFYNDGTGSSGSYLGEVQAMLWVRPDQGQLRSEWRVVKFTNSGGSAWESLGGGTLSNGLTVGQTYRLNLNWDLASKTFTFSDGVSTAQTFTTTDTPQSPKIGWKALQAYVAISDSTQRASDPALWGKISATFDNVTASGQDASGNAVVVSDNFSSDELDGDKWSSFEMVREIVGGKLVSRLRNVNIADTYINRLSIINPSQVNEIKAKVALLEYQNPGLLLYEDARIGGFFYNDTGDPNSGYKGEVFAAVSLETYPGRPLEARWYVVRQDDPYVTYQHYTAIAWGTFPLTVNLGQEYNLSIKWDGAQFTFKCDDDWATYAPTTGIFPANYNFKGLETRIYPQATPPMDYDGYISATFDDVQVGPGVPSSPTADLAVTITASPNPVKVGENLTYTVTVTNNGPDTASGLTATAYLPHQGAIVSLPLGCINGESMVTCTGTPLASGATATYIAVVNLTAGGQITNTVTVSSATTDPNLTNNTAVVTNTVKSSNQGDYDGDGKTDISVWRPGDGNWYVRNSATGTIAIHQWGLGSLNDWPVPGDFDGDGKKDYGIWRPGDGMWYILRSSDGGMTATQWGTGTFFAKSDVPVPGDYDGDGKTDIAVWRPGDGMWYILRSTDGGMTATQWGTGSLNDVPVPGDYDGDGKTDIAVWRPSTGMWYILRSSDGGMTITQWGTSALNDVPVPGDYDGDGKTDIGVWRPGDGNWYILRSSDGGMTITQWGTGTQFAKRDVPVPGDYDGDGKTDIGVWRPGDGNWYILRSSDGGMTITQWGTGDLNDISIAGNTLIYRYLGGGL